MSTSIPDMAELISILKKHAGEGNIVVIGVGNPLCGDDGVGVLIAQRLKSRGFAENVVIAGTNPENFISYIASKDPKVVIFVDAINADLEPGSVIFASLSDAEKKYGIFSTHNIPFSLVLKLIGNVKGYIFGIQAVNIRLGDKMHHNVIKAAEVVTNILEKILSSF